MAGVFLAYRRADGGWAGRLHDHLALRFGDDHVFQDVEDLPLGCDFELELAKAIKDCEAFLAVIGPQWLEHCDDQGRPRIGLEDDVLRTEIESALGKVETVIPVLVDGAAMPTSTELPPSIASLADRHAARLHTDRWTVDVENLMEELRKAVVSSRETPSLADAQRELYETQQQFCVALASDDNAEAALALMRSASQLLDEVLPVYPQDPMLKTARGHVYANESMALRRLQRPVEADQALEKVERVSRIMQTESTSPAGPIPDLVGDWETTEGGEQMAVRTIWNPEAKRYETTLLRLSQYQIAVGHSVGELIGLSSPTDELDMWRVEVMWRQGLGVPPQWQTNRVRLTDWLISRNEMRGPTGAIWVRVS